MLTDFDFARMRWLINRLPMARLNVDRALARSARMTAQYSDMPRGGNKASDLTAGGAVLLMAAKNAYMRLKDELCEMQAELQPYIDRLEHPLQRNAMQMRYIERRSAREIAYYLNYSEQHVFRVITRSEEKINVMRKNESYESS